MFKVNEDYIICVTRGDAGAFTFTAKNDDGTAFVFEAGSVVRLSVYEKKDTKNTVLQKDTVVMESATSVQICLTESETRRISKDSISKPTDYWYEIVLDPIHNPQTLLGYDEDGAKILRLYPEAEELPEDPIKEEDIPIVDKELDATSPRPIQNQAVAREIIKLKARIDKFVTVGEDGEIVKTMVYGDFVVSGTDGKKRRIVFSEGGSCSWDEVT